MPYGYGRQQRIIPPSPKSLHLPINHSNLMTPISQAPITEEQLPPPTIAGIPIQEGVFSVSEISTPSMLVSTLNVCETSSDVGISYSDEPGQKFLAASPSSTTPPPGQQKRQLSIGRSFLQKRSVAAVLQSLQSTRTSRNDTSMLRVNSKFYTIFQTLLQNFHNYFWLQYMSTKTYVIQNTSLNWSRLRMSRYRTNVYPSSNFAWKVFVEARLRSLRTNESSNKGHSRTAN